MGNTVEVDGNGKLDDTKGDTADSQGTQYRSPRMPHAVVGSRQFVFAN
jgi:hypothetical protein